LKKKKHLLEDLILLEKEKIRELILIKERAYYETHL